MTYVLTFLEHPDHLQVTMRGDRLAGDPVKRAREAWTHIATQCRSGGYDHLLVISHITGPYSPLAIYEVNSTLKDYCGVEPEWRIAYVNRDPDSQAQIQFGETVLQKKGLCMKVFTQDDEAIRWLKQPVGSTVG